LVLIAQAVFLFECGITDKQSQFITLGYRWRE